MTHDLPPAAAPQRLSLSEIVAPEPEVAGRIAVLDCAGLLPFEVKRVYWIHGMKKGERRGAHAHRRLSQAMVVVSGAVRFELDDGVTRRIEVLDRPNDVLIVGPDTWRDFTALKPRSTLLVLASAPYDESDYIRDYEAFLRYRGKA